MNTLLLNELPQFNGLALQMIWSMLGTFSCLHKDLASDMEQLFQSFAQQVNPLLSVMRRCSRATELHFKSRFQTAFRQVRNI